MIDAVLKVRVRREAASDRDRGERESMRFKAKSNFQTSSFSPHFYTESDPTFDGESSATTCYSGEEGNVRQRSNLTPPILVLRGFCSSRFEPLGAI